MKKPEQKQLIYFEKDGGKDVDLCYHEEKEAVWLKADRTVDILTKQLKLMKN